MVTTVKVPPDGGYGWVIVFANALSNLMILPLMASFGLIFKDTFANMGLSATEGSLIINLNAAFGMILGLINGVLLKVYGFRKIAFIGAALVFTGLTLTSFATTFTHFMLSYGIVTSIGMGLILSSYGLAMNTYFRKNKAKAFGLTAAITGLGPVLMPQLINLLMSHYSVQGTSLMLAGISAHSFIAAILLQPVKRHMKTVVLEDEKVEVPEKEPEQTQVQIEEKVVDRQRLFPRSVSQFDRTGDTSPDPEFQTDPIYGMDSGITGSILSINSIIGKKSITSATLRRAASVHVLQEIPETHQGIVYPELSAPIKKESFLKHSWISISNFFDFDLLKDPIYVNMMLGMSFAIFAELNFSILTAFILADFGLNTNEIARFLSVLGITDIIFRFLSPYIEHYLHKPPRIMYMLTLFLLMISRFCLLISTNMSILLVVALFLGVAKGLRTVYMSLVIPSYVSLEKLPSASGIQMMVNGIFIISVGPIIGVVRDVTGSYSWCIVILNCITFTTVIMWMIEFIIVRIAKKKTAPQELSEQKDILLNGQ